MLKRRGKGLNYCQRTLGYYQKVRSSRTPFLGAVFSEDVLAVVATRELGGNNWDLLNGQMILLVWIVR